MMTDNIFVREKEHVKLLINGTNDPNDVAATIKYVLKIKDIKIFESSINDNQGLKVNDVWVLEFDAKPYKVVVLKKFMNLEEIDGYLVL